MKITKLFAAALFFIAASMNAQEISNHAFGLRLGESDGFGAELSYQKSVGRYSRIELNAGYRDSREFDAFKALFGVLQHPIHIGLWDAGFLC